MGIGQTISAKKKLSRGIKFTTTSGLYIMTVHSVVQQNIVEWRLGMRPLHARAGLILHSRFHTFFVQKAEWRLGMRLHV